MAWSWCGHVLRGFVIGWFTVQVLRRPAAENSPPQQVLRRPGLGVVMGCSWVGPGTSWMAMGFGLVIGLGLPWVFGLVSGRHGWVKVGQRRGNGFGTVRLGHWFGFVLGGGFVEPLRGCRRYRRWTSNGQPLGPQYRREGALLALHTTSDGLFRRSTRLALRC